MAIQMMTPVLSVRTHVSDIGFHVACERARRDLHEVLRATIDNFEKDQS